MAKENSQKYQQAVY